jgi:hypothetical protein
LFGQHFQKPLKPDLGVGAGVGIVVIERTGIFKPDAYKHQHDLLEQSQFMRARGVAFIEPIEARFDGVGERLACDGPQDRANAWPSSSCFTRVNAGATSSAWVASM